jgi:hypothetical protein
MPDIIGGRRHECILKLVARTSSRWPILDRTPPIRSPDPQCRLREPMGFAAMWRFFLMAHSLVADDEDARDGFDDIVGDDWSSLILRTPLNCGNRRSRSLKYRE